MPGAYVRNDLVRDMSGLGCKQARVLSVGLCTSWRFLLACGSQHNILLTSVTLPSAALWFQACTQPAGKASGHQRAHAISLLHGAQHMPSAAVQVDIYAAGVVL